MVAEFAVDVVADSALDELSKNSNFSKYMMQLIDRGYTDVFTISPAKFERSHIQEDNPWLKFSSFEDNGDFSKYKFIKLTDKQLTDDDMRDLVKQTPVKARDRVGIETGKKRFYTLFVTDIDGVQQGLTKEIFKKHVFNTNNFRSVKANFIKLMDNISNLKITQQSFIDDVLEFINKAKTLDDLADIRDNILKHSEKVDINMSKTNNKIDYMPDVSTDLDSKFHPDEDFIPVTSTSPRAIYRSE